MAFDAKSALLKLVHVVLGGTVFAIFLARTLYIQNENKNPDTLMKVHNSHRAITDEFRFIAQVFSERFVLSGGTFYVFITTFAFLITSFLLLISSFCDDVEQRNKSIFEILYHVFGFIFQLAAGIVLLVPAVKGLGYTRIEGHTHFNNLYWPGLVFTFVNSVAYAGSAVIAVSLRKK